MKLNLNFSQLYSSIDTERPISHHSTASRVASKRGLDPNVIQSCLQSLDVFRDLLQGIPHQKNRVVRDVCKNVQLTKFFQGDVIYDVGEKADAVYFCISGSVSICITKQVPKQQKQQKQQKIEVLNQLPQQKSAKIQQNNSSRAPNSMTNNQAQVILNSLQQVQQFQKVDEEIDCVETGQGFGEAQFISQTKRVVKAICKDHQTVIAKLEVEHFTQVLQNYKQRVYYKKRDMFQKCALFSKLPLNKLQFIINNTKPMTINISQILVAQGSEVDTIYLINKGQVCLCKKGIQSIQYDMEEDQYEQLQIRSSGLDVLSKSKSRIQLKKIKSNQGINNQKMAQSTQNSRKKIQVQNILSPKNQVDLKSSKLKSSGLKLRTQKSPLPKQKDHKIFIGLLSQSCFLGDMELVLGTEFKFNALCKTQKAQIYYCDRRIIMSQMTPQYLQQVQGYYKQKQKYLLQKIRKYKQAKERIQQKQKRDLLPPLNKKQIELKRKIMHRYVQEKHSLIGQSSPMDIEKMIKRKELRVIKQPQNSRFPILELFPSHSVKKRSQSPLLSPRSFNPLSLVQVPGRKCITQFDEYNQQGQKKEDKPLSSLKKIRRNKSLVQQQNPEIKQTQELYKMKSIMIKIKPSKLDLSDLKYGRQKNMAIVTKILGRYKKCENKFKSINEVISKIQKSSV